ncbi:MAG: diiron oxygenase [Cellvibrionales bacterium]|nr:diiron oxygenase [Cellvibrionales bacterium]
MDSTKLANKLSERSKTNFYNVYSEFDWPDSLPKNEFWLTPSLMTLYNTEYYDKASIGQRYHLSQLETINLFSIFAHGESDLLRTILDNCFNDDLDEFKEYLIHFIDEENKHMWFFSEFCRRYDSGVLPSRKFKSLSKFPNDVERLLSFLRILVFEEIGDYFNTNTFRNNGVNEFVKKIHERHHLDEVGHIAIGWKISENLFLNLPNLTADMLTEMEKYIEAYMQSSLQSLYNPDIYQRVGFDAPYNLRESLLKHPAREEMHSKILKRSRSRVRELWALYKKNNTERQFI